MSDQFTEACGTRAGYYRHNRRGDTPCGACRAAVAAYVRERYRLIGREGKREQGTAARDGRCPDCGYLRTAPGHLASCGTGATS